MIIIFKFNNGDDVLSMLQAQWHIGYFVNPYSNLSTRNQLAYNLKKLIVYFSNIFKRNKNGIDLELKSNAPTWQDCNDLFLIN